MIAKFVSKIISKPGGALIRLSRLIYVPAPDPHQVVLQRWFADKGDLSYRLNYKLGEDSIVFDLGGYEGQFASDIYAMYRCKVYVFELSKSYAENIRKRFAGNSDIHVFDFGLAPSDSSSILYLNDERSSVFTETGKSEEVEFRSILNILDEQKIRSVDLIKLNIEGGEFELLEHLLSSGKISLFKNIQVQFHDLEKGSAERMNKIKGLLSETHMLTYEYPFVWENWQLK